MNAEYPERHDVHTEIQRPGCKMRMPFMIRCAAGGAALALLMAPSAQAAEPHSGSLARYVGQAEGICRTATAQLNRELNIGGDNPTPGQILLGFSEEGRTFLWESRAFLRLPVPPVARHAHAGFIPKFYKYAGQEMGFAVQEYKLGDDAQAEVDIRYSDKSANDAAAVADQLGIRSCDGE